MSIFKKLIKAGVDTVLTPVEVVRDVVTLGGVNTNQKKSYTQQRLGSLKEALGDAYDELDD